MIVGIHNTSLISPHKVRGVGFYTKRLIKALGKIAAKDKNFSLKIDSHHSLVSGVDLIHYPFFEPFFLNLPIFKKNPTIVTVHDLIPLRFPKHFPPGVRGKLKWHVQKFSLRTAKAIITDSLASKKDIIRFTGLDKNRIFVVYLAADEIFKPVKNKSKLGRLRKKYNLPEKFVLYVGDLNFNKNVNFLVQSCLQLNYLLVVVGKQAIEKPKDKSHIENQGLIKFQKLAEDNPGKIIRLGFVPTNDLVGIYNLATVYVQPSFAEGFGLPVLEAMACGCPVIASKRTSLEEIADEAAILIDPYKSRDLIKALKLCFSGESVRMRFSKLGLRQTAKFSWEKTARETLGVYKDIYNENL